jgi:hypothetical protein
VNRRTVTFAAVAAVLLAGAAGAARVALGHTPAGYESGYSPPDTVVLVGADGVTLWAGIGGCYEHTALQALERPGSVLLRVSWRTRPNCGFPPGWAVTPRLPSLNLQVGLSAPLGGRRLVGPDGAALPRLDEAQMLTTLTARARARLGMYPGSPQLQEPVFEPMFPAARCLRSVINPGRLLLDQCAYGGAAGTGSGHTLTGTTVTGRGRPGHLVDHAPGAPPWSGYEYSWRALWWTEGDEIVVLASKRFRGDPPLPPGSRLVAVANALSCPKTATCR